MLPKCTHLWERKIMKRPASMNTLMKVLSLTHLILMIGWKSSNELWCPHARSQLPWRMRWTMKWWNEHLCNKRWVTIKGKGANNEECGDNMIWG